MKNVLIVEDDLWLADILQDTLEQQGYHVGGIARTEDEAITLAQQYQPDFAVIDVHLADGGLGTKVGVRLRKTTNIRIMYITGSDEDELMKIVGDAVMTKPYRLKDVDVGLKIIGQLAEFGYTHLPYPSNFRLLDALEV